MELAPQKHSNKSLPDWARSILAVGLFIVPIVLYVISQVISVNSTVGILMLLIVGAFALVFFPTGLTALLIFLPLEPFLVKFIPVDFVFFFRLIPEVIIGALFIRGSYQYLAEKKYKSGSHDPILLPLFFFIGIALLSILINHVSIPSALIGLRQYLRFIVLYLALVFYGLRRKHIIAAISIVAFMAFFEATLGLVQALVGSRLDSLLSTYGKSLFAGEYRVSQEIFQIRTEGQRIFATMGRYDQLGTFLALVSSVSLGFIYRAKDQYKKIAFGLLVIMLPALLLTYSRASWFGFILGLIVAAIIIQKDKKVLAILLLSIVAVATYTVSQEVEVRRLIDQPSQTPINRLLEAFSTKRFHGEYTAKGRVFFWVEAPKALFPSYALLGVGPGRFGGGAAALMHNTEAYDALNLPFGIYGVEGQIDNNWLSIFGETGVLGFLAYAAMFIFIFRYANMVRKDPDSDWLAQSLALGLIATTIGYVLQGAFGTYFEVRTLSPYYWLLVALTVSAYRLSKQPKVSLNS